MLEPDICDQFSQEIGSNTTQINHKPDDEPNLFSDREEKVDITNKSNSPGSNSLNSDDSALLCPFVFNPTPVNNKKLICNQFKKGDIVWAKHRDEWWPAVIKNIYKAKRCATVIWTDENEVNRKKYLRTGFKIRLKFIRPWSCPERKKFTEEGEKKHKLRFEDAVGMLDNFLRKKATGEIKTDIFDYLSKVHGSLYTLYNCDTSNGGMKNNSAISGYGPQDYAISPDIKKVKLSSVDREGQYISPETNSQNSMTSGLGDDDDDNNTDVDSETDEEGTNNNRAKRNLEEDMKVAEDCGRLNRIVEFLQSEDCLNKMSDIHNGIDKSFLRVFHNFRPRQLKEAKLYNFGPFRSDETIDKVMDILKGMMKTIAGKEMLTTSDVQYLMDVWLPESLSYALEKLEGKNINDALIEIWSPLK